MLWVRMALRISWLLSSLSRANAKAGVPGIKLKTTGNLDEATDYPELSAVVGSSVSLPCSLSPPSPDDSIALVLWYRLDLPNPIYTLDARTVPADKAKHFSSKVLSTRGYFNLTRRPAALHLYPVEEHDSGEYRCRVDFRRGRTLSRLAKLNVIVPVKRVEIKDKDNITYSGLIGPFIEGTSLVLICEAKGGRPTPVVVWKQGPNILPGTVSQDERGTVRNELTFLHLQSEDLLAVLTCEASNNNFTSPARSSVTIDLSLKPRNVQITTAPTTMTAGERLEVSCQSEGSRPPARITWLKGNDHLDHLASENVFGDVTVSTLSYMVTADDNGKYLMCRAQNPDLPESALEDRWLLNVRYPPQLSLVLGASEQYEHIREGSDVYFECNIQANPSVTDVKWRFQSRRLLHEPVRGVIIKNHSLLLHNVGRSHRGIYQCLASNDEGQGMSEEALLSIQFSPVCKSNQRVLYGVSRHDETRISCEVEADPAEVSFRWAFNNTSETIDILSYSSVGTRSFARYIPRTKLDYGAVFCWAKNSIGSQKEPCVFTIVPTGPPEPLQNCTITNQTFSMLAVTCESGEDGGLPQTFHLEVYAVSGEQLIANFTTTGTPVLVARGLPTGKSFIVVLYASNSKGRSSTVALTASTLFSAERQTVSENRTVFSAVLLVSMAALGTLSLLAIAAVVAVVKNRNRHNVPDPPVEQEMAEKIPKPTPKAFDESNTYIYHTRNSPTEYVHLTPNTAADRIYESLVDGKPNCYEKSLANSHGIKDEGLEVIIPVIER